MLMFKESLLILLLLLCAAMSHAKEERTIITLWPAGTAQVDPSIQEVVVPRKIQIIKNIHNPNLTVFRPQNPNGTAVIICPGGGYGVLATEHEGQQVAEKLNTAGITAFVLKYRLPTTAGAAFKHPVPLSDALRAIQWVRYHADDYMLDPGRIGIMGFSAGGHLAASAGTLYAKYSFGSDAIARVSSRPDFMALCYAVISTNKAFAHGCVRHLLDPGYSPQQLAELSCELNVNAQTPPTFLMHAMDDRGVLPQNSVAMHAALQAQGVPAELKLYANGGHGFGLGNPKLDSGQWSDSFIDWVYKLEHLKLTQ